ncbi:MAG: hypothetical protein ABI688_04490 [Bacteroidota bacterium]
MKYKKIFPILVCSLLFCCQVIKGQTTPKPDTKLFFEVGYENCRISVINQKDILYQGSITTPRGSGAAAIVPIAKLKGTILKLNICGRTKQITVIPGKFYAISFLENYIIVEELDKEPFYVLEPMLLTNSLV